MNICKSMVPIISILIKPKTKSDKENMLRALKVEAQKRLDLWIYTYEGNKILLAGSSQGHLELLVERLVSEDGIELSFGNFEVMYKVAIKSSVKAEGRFIRQSGGSQYGHCWIEFEPNEPGKGYEFANKVLNEATIPNEFIEHVKEGIAKTLMIRGLGRYPIVDIKATLFDGSYHPSDSKYMSYQIAAAMSVIAALSKVEQLLLEPIMKYNITVEEECIADITKLISSRRGKLKKVDVSNGKVVFIAFVPLVEILKNSSELSLEYQGQTLVFNEFSHYSEVSTSISEQVISGSNLLDGNILDISSIKDEQEEIIIKEIDRCTEGINNYPNGKFSLNIESLQDCLAYAFIKLSFIRNPNENILKALQAYGKASNICLRENFEKYPIAQENIGNSYKHLSKIIDSEKNLSKAIEAYNEAISASEIFAKDKFKNKQIQSELINIYVEFGKNYNAQLGLGHAYMEFGNITKNEENYLKAIDAFNS